MRKTIGDTIGRASVKFELKDGSQAGELVIENERLKTSIMVLQQKLNVQDHTLDENEKLQKENTALLNENDELKVKVSGLES